MRSSTRAVVERTATFGFVVERRYSAMTVFPRRVGVVDEEAPVASVLRVEREAEQASLAAAVRRATGYRGTALGTSLPPLTTRIRPPCSTTNSRPLPSPAPVMKSGEERPPVTRARDRRTFEASKAVGGRVAGVGADIAGRAIALAPLRHERSQGDEDEDGREASGWVHRALPWFRVASRSMKATSIPWLGR